jgi:hypothetical protein
MLSLFAGLIILAAPAAFAESGGSGRAAEGQEEGEFRGPPPGRHPHRRPDLTDAQRTCLEGILGKPGQGERPSHEKMSAAMKSCGVAKPPRGGRPPRGESSAEEGQEQQD